MFTVEFLYISNNAMFVVSLWGISASLRKSTWKPNQNHLMTRQTIPGFGHGLTLLFLIQFLISKSMGTVRDSICPCWLVRLLRSAPCIYIYGASDRETNDSCVPFKQVEFYRDCWSFHPFVTKNDLTTTIVKAWSFQKTVNVRLIHYWTIHLAFGYSRACWTHFGMGKYSTWPHSPAVLWIQYSITE